MIVLAWELMGIYRLGLVFAKIRGKQKVLQRFQSVAKISMSLQVFCVLFVKSQCQEGFDSMTSQPEPLTKAPFSYSPAI